MKTFSHLEKMNTFALVYDIESTGLDTKTDRPIQIAAVLCKVGQKGQLEPTGVEFESYIQTSVPIDPASQYVHGISESTVMHAPDFATVIGRLAYAIGIAVPRTDRVILMAHNGKVFDDV